MNICPYVSQIGEYIFVNEAFDIRDELILLGFIRVIDSDCADVWRYKRHSPDTSEGLSVVLSRLRNMGVAFSVGKDWSP